MKTDLTDEEQEIYSVVDIRGTEEKIAWLNSKVHCCVRVVLSMLSSALRREASVLCHIY